MWEAFGELLVGQRFRKADGQVWEKVNVVEARKVDHPGCGTVRRVRAAMKVEVVDEPH